MKPLQNLGESALTFIISGDVMAHVKDAVVAEMDTSKTNPQKHASALYSLRKAGISTATFLLNWAIKIAVEWEKTKTAQ